MKKFKIVFVDFLGAEVIHEGEASSHRQLAILRAYAVIKLGDETHEFRWHKSSLRKYAHGGYFQEFSPASRSLYVSHY